MKLTLEHTFYWYDGPILFLASCPGAYFLGEAFPEDKHVLIRVSYKRFRNLMYGLTTIRQAQMFPEYDVRNCDVGSRWMIDDTLWDWHPASSSVVNNRDY